MDKKLIHQATVNTEEPTPGYLFKDLIEMTYLDISSVQHLVEFLISKVKDHIEDELSYSLMKTLKVIRQLCLSGHEEFQGMMQQHVDVLKSAIAYRGGLSDSDGNATGKIVKLCAREAIESLYVPHKKVRMTAASSAPKTRMNIDEEKHISHPNDERIANIYRQQHCKSAYVAPKVPMRENKESIAKLESVEADQEEFQGETDVIQERKTHVRRTIDKFTGLERDLERLDLKKLHENFLTLLRDWQGDSLWEEVSLVLNDALSIGNTWKTKRNSATVIEFLLEKGIPTVLQFFGENRTNLLDCRNGVYFSLRQKVTRVLEMLPACSANSQEKDSTKPCEEKSSETTQKSMPVIEKAQSNRDKNKIHRRQPLVPSLSGTTAHLTQEFSNKLPPSIDDFFTSKSEVRPNCNEANELQVNHSASCSDSPLDDFSDLHDVLSDMIMCDL